MNMLEKVLMTPMDRKKAMDSTPFRLLEKRPSFQRLLDYREAISCILLTR